MEYYDDDYEFWSLEIKFLVIFNQNKTIVIEGNAFENVVCKMASILCQPQCSKEIKDTHKNSQSSATTDR